MLTTIEHPDGKLKACITERRGSFFVAMYERVGDSEIAAFPTGERGARRYVYNWNRLWRAEYDCAFHVLCDLVHDHVMASRRDVLQLPN